MVEQIRQYMQTAWLKESIIYEESMDSTNIRAKIIGEENVTCERLVVTKKQTAGRGRMGRDWISPKGNCYFSLLLRPDVKLEHVARITLVAALALAETVYKVTDLHVQIKWPNDVVVNGKKLCGILTESSTDANGLKYVIVGIGVNANQEVFDESIEDMATSIFCQTGQKVSCGQIIGEFVNCFENMYTMFCETEDLSMFIDRYNQMLVNCNHEVRIIDKTERVVEALGINEKGELLVQDDEGCIETIMSGEVSVRGLYGYV